MHGPEERCIRADMVERNGVVHRREPDCRQRHQRLPASLIDDEAGTAILQDREGALDCAQSDRLGRPENVLE